MTIQRLETLNELDTIFERANTSATDIGTWRSDDGGTTSTTRTGPGSNSDGAYVYSESSQDSTSDSSSDIHANSVLTVRSEIMSAWTGSGRQLILRASIAGDSWTETGEGLEVQGRFGSVDSWSRIELIEGWAYSNDYSAGDSITDAAGDSFSCAQDGGWIDFSVTIPDSYTEVRIRSRPIVTGTQNLYRHDAALWSIEFQDGTPVTVPILGPISDFTVAQGANLSQELPAAIGGSGVIIYSVTGRADWMEFDPVSRILSGTAPNEFSVSTITYTATDEDSESAIQTFRVRVQMGLHDLPVPVGRETRLRMLVQVGTNELYRESHTGTLLDSTNPLHRDTLVPGLRVNRIRYGQSNKLTLNRTGTVTFASQFEGATPPLIDGMWHVFTESGMATYSVQTPDELDEVGSSFYRTTVGSSDDTSVMDSISTGDRIILAFTMPVPPNNAPTISFASQSSILDGNEVFTVTGTVADMEDDDGNVAVSATTTLGSVSTVTNQNGNWSLDLTAPPVTDSAQTMTVTATATDSGGLSTSASRDWMVRANQNPTVMITTPGGQQTPGTTIDLRAAASGPEPDQTVMVLWEIVSGGGSLSNPASLDAASIALPGYATTERTVQIRITATDSLEATAVDTVDFTLPAASPPDIPDTLDLTVLGATSIRAAFADPPTHLPITQHDIRFRETGTEDWTARTAVTLPYEITDLTPGIPYDVEGRAHSAAGASAWGGIVMARTIANAPPTISIDTAPSLVDGLESITVSGTVTDDLDDSGSIEVTASTDIGTVSTPVNTDGTWTLTLTAPAVTAQQQPMALMVTATDSHGGTATATRTWMVRANQNPTVMITTPGGQQTPGTTIDLRAAASGPEPDQTVMVLWEIVSGGGSLSNPASLDAASIALPGYATTERTVQIRITATDSLEATAVDTVDFTLPAASPPDIPDTLDLTVLGATSIRAAFADPPTHLPITQHDIRFRETGTEDWTARTAVTLPYEITDLTPDIPYDVEGRAHSAAGASAWGGIVMATPSAPIIALQVEAASESSLVATWRASTEDTETISSYDIRISVAGRNTWQESHGVISPYTFSDLEQGVSYEVQIRFVDSHGTSPWSPSSHAATHLILTATLIRNRELVETRTDWDPHVIYKVHMVGPNVWTTKREK